METVNKNKLLIAISIVVFLLSLVVNYLFMGNVQNVKAVSDSYQTVLTPIPLTFAIWGIIYSLAVLTIATWYIRIESHRHTHSIVFFIVITILNMLWIVTFTSRAILISWVLIVMMYCMLYIQNKVQKPIKRYIDVVPKAFFELYFGWITVATILNSISLLLYLGAELNETKDFEQIIAPMILFVIVLISVRKSVQGNYIYPLAILWAIMGIYLKNKGEDGFLKYIAIVCMALIIFFNIFFMLQNVYRKRFAKNI